MLKTAHTLRQVIRQPLGIELTKLKIRMIKIKFLFQINSRPLTKELIFLKIIYILTN